MQTSRETIGVFGLTIIIPMMLQERQIFRFLVNLQAVNVAQETFQTLLS